jgi:radical SAM-linked protein
MRVRIHFAKTDAMRFTGHLDLFRTWERTIRRASLPLSYTLGYRPGPKMNLAAALPLGFTSDCELIDIWLDYEIGLEEIKSALIQAAPPGIIIFDLESVDPRGPSLQSMMAISEYRITLYEELTDLAQRIDELMSSDTLIRRWREKEYDLRHLIQFLEIDREVDSGHQTLKVQLSAKEGATGRPEEIILALGGNPHTSRVHRTQLVFNKEPVLEATG